MTTTTPQLSYEQLVHMARRLPLAERVRLVRDILAEPEQEAHTPRESLYGMLAGQGPVPSEDEFRATRREMWGMFSE